MGTRPQFQSIAMSAAFTQLLPTLTFATMQPHKVGGIVVTPREISEQSIVQFGQFLAMYGAVEFARAEDTWAFMADGSNTYEGVEGVCKVCTDLDKIITLGSTLTAPSDATLADFRAMRRKVSTAVLGFNGAYYLNKTWEIRLRDFNTQADPHVFVILPDGSARLDGYPVIWTEVLTAYDVDAAASSYLSVFGNLRFWWFGERGSPRSSRWPCALIPASSPATGSTRRSNTKCSNRAATIMRLHCNTSSAVPVRKRETAGFALRSPFTTAAVWCHELRSVRSSSAALFPRCTAAVVLLWQEVGRFLGDGDYSRDGLWKGSPRVAGLLPEFHCSG